MAVEVALVLGDVGAVGALDGEGTGGAGVRAGDVLVAAGGQLGLP